MIREFSTIYVTLAGKILKHAIATKDKNLELIHDQFKVSPLYNRLLKYKRQSISSQTPEAVDSEEISRILRSLSMEI